MFVQCSFLDRIGWMMNLRPPALGCGEDLLAREGNSLLDEDPLLVKHIRPSRSGDEDFFPFLARQPNSKPLHLPIFLFICIREGLRDLSEE